MKDQALRMFLQLSLKNQYDIINMMISTLRAEAIIDFYDGNITVEKYQEICSDIRSVNQDFHNLDLKKHASFFIKIMRLFGFYTHYDDARDDLFSLFTRLRRWYCSE